MNEAGNLNPVWILAPGPRLLIPQPNLSFSQCGRAESSCQGDGSSISPFGDQRGVNDPKCVSCHPLWALGVMTLDRSCGRTQGWGVWQDLHTMELPFRIYAVRFEPEAEVMKVPEGRNLFRDVSQDGVFLVPMLAFGPFQPWSQADEPSLCPVCSFLPLPEEVTGFITC